MRIAGRVCSSAIRQDTLSVTARRARGAKEVEAVNFLEKKVKSGPSFDVNQTAQLAISALQHVLGEEVKASELEVAVVTADNPNFRVISESEVEDHLTSISERD